MTDDPEWVADLELVIDRTHHEPYRRLTAVDHPEAKYWRGRVRLKAVRIRNETSYSTDSYPSLITSNTISYADAYQAEQAHLESLVLACPYREPLSTNNAAAGYFAPPSKPCGCTARCRRGRGRPEDGLVGHHVCLQCVAGA
jgi:hypothetical protein